MTDSGPPLAIELESAEVAVSIEIAVPPKILIQIVPKSAGNIKLTKTTVFTL